MKQVLYIEDNLADVTLFEEAIKDNQSKIELTIIGDAEDFLSFLNTHSGNSDDMPDLIISDVSLPKISGTELIKKIKTNSSFKDVPVVAYSTSSYQKDIDSCLANGASAYYQKPMNYYDTQKVLKEIFDTWLYN